MSVDSIWTIITSVINTFVMGLLTCMVVRLTKKQVRQAQIDSCNSIRIQLFDRCSMVYSTYSQAISLMQSVEVHNSGIIKDRSLCHDILLRYAEVQDRLSNLCLEPMFDGSIVTQLKDFRTKYILFVIELTKVYNRLLSMREEDLIITILGNPHNYLKCLAENDKSSDKMKIAYENMISYRESACHTLEESKVLDRIKAMISIEELVSYIDDNKKSINL